MSRKDNNDLKRVLFIYGGILLILIITSVIVYILYNNKVKESAKQSLIAAQKITDIVPNSEVLEDVSSQISKTIEEVIEKDNNETIDIPEEEDIDEVVEEIPEENIQETESNGSETAVEEPVKELEFIYPVEGEIIKEFAIDNLVFSETLQEWIVHKGIDIKSPRTTVVKSAEEGIIKSIKNDPRYGLTVIIEHRDGYKTVYSNLLTTEFVTEGEEISKGQTIGTVGNSAAFEIADEPHLHFEMIKDEEPVNPTVYLK